MKMRMFTAPTMEEALAMMQADLGPDAVLLSSREDNGVVEIRGAIERSFGHRYAAPSYNDLRPFIYDEARDELSRVLREQCAPDAFTHLVAEAGSRLGAGLETLGSLTAALEGVLTFAPIAVRPPASFILVGPPGSGKTTAAAKLAIQMRDRDSQLEPVSADFDCSGQTARLAAMLMRPSVPAALSPDGLIRMVRQAEQEGRRLVIDGPPFNPLDPDEMGRLKSLIRQLNVEPILVLSAEGNSLDLEDNARSFAQCGARRVVVSKLDLVRRRGAIFAAISSARLSIAQLGLTPNARCRLAPASAANIARLFLAGPPEARELVKGAA